MKDEPDLIDGREKYQLPLVEFISLFWWCINAKLKPEPLQGLEGIQCQEQTPQIGSQLRLLGSKVRFDKATVPNVPQSSVIWRVRYFALYSTQHQL